MDCLCWLSDHPTGLTDHLIDWPTDRATDWPTSGLTDGQIELMQLMVSEMFDVVMMSRLWVHRPGSRWSADRQTQEELQQSRGVARSSGVTPDVIHNAGRSHQSYQPSCQRHWAWSVAFVTYYLRRWKVLWRSLSLCVCVRRAVYTV